MKIELNDVDAGVPESRFRVGDTHVIRSSDDQLNLAVGRISKEVVNWRKCGGNALYAAYVSRLIEPYNKIPLGGRVYEVIIRRVSPTFQSTDERKPVFGLHQGVWVNEAEIGKPINAFRDKLTYMDVSKFSEDETTQYLANPLNCPFLNCFTNIAPLVVGIGLRDNALKVKYECLNCEGTWTTSFTPTGLE